MKTATKEITNLQHELLKIFHFELKKSQLQEVKGLLASYFADKTSNEMDRVWKDKNWTNKTIDKLAKQHLRTSYK